MTRDTSTVPPGSPFLQAFLSAWNSHDVAAIAQLYRDDAIMVDPTLKYPLHGRSAIATYYQEQWHEAPDSTLRHVASWTHEMTTAWLWLYAIHLSADGRFPGATVFEMAQDQIAVDRAIWNPVSHSQVFDLLLPVDLR